MNHGNLLVSQDGTVALIDCDSFEITDGQRWFSCPVGVREFTPPELQGKSFTRVRRTQQHDTFGLAVLIFQMLFLGRHSFIGIFRRGTDDIGIPDAIREFRFAYSPDKRLTEMEQPAWVPPLTIYPADLGNLFMQAFGRDGVNGKRPTAHEWIPRSKAWRATSNSAQRTNHTNTRLGSLSVLGAGQRARWALRCLATP